MQMVLYLQVIIITHEQRYTLNSTGRLMPLSKKSRKKVGASPKRDFHNLNFEHAVSNGLILECLLSAFIATVVVFGTWTIFFARDFFGCSVRFVPVSSRNPSLLRRVNKIYYVMLEMIC